MPRMGTEYRSGIRYPSGALTTTQRLPRELEMKSILHRI